MPPRHGLVKTQEYNSWCAMRQRCTNPNRRYYHRYGGRGIKVCRRWNSFANFLADMGNKPSPGHWLDRIDNNKDYKPDNCRWATAKEQQNNRGLRVKCRRGLHLIEGANEGVKPTGARYCKACHVKHLERRRERRKLSVRTRNSTLV